MMFTGVISLKRILSVSVSKRSNYNVVTITKAGVPDDLARL